MKKLIWITGLCLALVACDEASDSSKIGGEGCSPLDYKNGVFYFPCIEATFGNALSTFRKNHPSLRVTAMTSDDTGGYGHAVGYFITAEEQ